VKFVKVRKIILFKTTKTCKIKFLKQIYFRKEFDLLDGYYIKNLQDILYQTLDGCVLSDPPKTDIVKTYVETFNASYLVLVKQFWKDCYSNMDVKKII
jgi:hypothetical protein